MAENGKLGVLAGGGELPGRLAGRCRERGIPLFILGFKGHVEPGLAVDATVRIGAVGQIIRLLRRAGISRLVMVGRVSRPRWHEIIPDLAALRLIRRWLFSGDDGLLRAVIGVIEEEGWRVAGIEEFLPELLAPIGVLTARKPDENEWLDIRIGLAAAKALGAQDRGQAVVIRSGKVAGEEDRSGTDALIGRCRGQGGLLVKALKPGQERRVDLPTVGVRTIEKAAAAGLSGIAVEAGSTLIAEREAVIAAADRLGLFLAGVEDGDADDREAPLFFIVAGEPSGDLIGARIMTALSQATGGQVRFAGIGGENMEKLGLRSLVPLHDLAVMGLFEVLPRIPRILGHLRRTVEEIERTRPAAIITIDSWGFTGRLAKTLKERGSAVPRIHVVAPMVWAWKEKRANTLAQRLDLLLTLLPNEPPYFERHGLKTIHIGHPVLEGGADKGDGPAFRTRHAIPAEAPLLAVLPGSRRSETSRLLPAFGQCIELLKERFPGLHVVVPTVDTVAGEVAQAIGSWSVPAILVRGAGEKFDAFAAADAAIAASGTVAVELAMAGTPHLIAYKVNPLTAMLARRMLKIRHVDLVNILLGRQAVPEFLQENCQAERLAEALARLMTDESMRAAQKADFAEALDRLGRGGPSPGERAAAAIISLIPSFLRSRRKPDDPHPTSPHHDPGPQS